MDINDRIVEIAKSQIGVKWKHQGRVAGKSLDCLGFILYVGNELGIIPEGHDDDNYRRQGDLVKLQAALETYGDEVKRSDIKKGDVLYFITDGNYPHLGIALDDTFFIHASAADRKVCEARLVNEMKARLLKVYRLKETIKEAL